MARTHALPPARVLGARVAAVATKPPSLLKIERIPFDALGALRDALGDGGKRVRASEKRSAKGAVRSHKV